MPQVRIRQQRQLFEEPLPALGVHLSLEVKEQLRQILAQRMQVQARTIRMEVSDEQDHR